MPGLNGQVTAKLRYHDDMKRPGLRRLLWLGKKAVLLIPDPAPVVKKEKACSFKVIGLASIAVGAAALGLFIGREFRSRYNSSAARLMTGSHMLEISYCCG